MTRVAMFMALAALNPVLSYAQDVVASDSTVHKVQFVTVADGVKLEVLDWGGSGRPIVLLTGRGDTAHVFDQFAPKLTPSYHVYGITRRGFGASSVPASGYSADRLGDDVLGVLDTLQLSQPVLIGHSIAGEELSSIASRRPDRVAALIYLDAGYSYAYYDPAELGAISVDLAELQRRIERLHAGEMTSPLIRELLRTTLPKVEEDLRRIEKTLPPGSPQSVPPRPLSPVNLAIMAGQQKYTDIRCPVLAIFSKFGSDEVADGFEKGVASARVVRLPEADHYMFRSNEADVLREVNAFLSNLR
jgi:pimeloyl-ACP methyl ester carboxylesterase